MSDSSSKPGPTGRSKGGAERRKERLAQALRANLKRRKQAGGGRLKAGKDKKTGGRRDTPG
jgi:hypothetical protein